MCNLSKGVEEKGIAKGLAKGRAEGRAEGYVEGLVSALRNLMVSMNLSIEDAMITLKIPEEDRSRYAELLAKQ